MMFLVQSTDIWTAVEELDEQAKILEVVSAEFACLLATKQVISAREDSRAGRGKESQWKIDG